MARGTLRIYLGAAPGVGKTFAVLGEAHRRRERGCDVVVGLVETHGRPRTAAAVEGLEVLPRARVTHRGVTLDELDVEAVLARRPDVVVIDELAHTNVPGSRHEKRWQDVEQVLDAGISVLTTVNVQHLESPNDVVEQITGVPQQETVPDAVVRRADQIELVDMSPEALRRRLAHGNVYPAERVDAAMGHWFRVGNLTALRELALLWLADRVDEGLRTHKHDHAIDHVWEARERVVVTLTGGPEDETLIRRASRVARRSGNGVLLAVHVLSGDGLAGASSGALRAQRALVESLGGSYHQVVGDDVAEALLEFARGVDATQLVIGTSRRPRWARALRGGIGGRVIAGSGEIDVHIVTHSAAGSQGWRLPRSQGALTARRRWLGWLVAVVGVPVLALSCIAAQAALSLASVLLAFVLLVTAVAIVGGLGPALAAVAVQQGRLAAQAAEASRLAAGNSMRNALLAAVSHDLRTPLAGIKAAASALRTEELALSEEDRAELVATVDESADRLTGLVDNLLDMSRLQAGVVTPAAHPVDVAAVVGRALTWLDPAQRRRVTRPDAADVPPALADPGLLERVVANLLLNAAGHATGGLQVDASSVDGRVEVRVVDRVPCVPARDRDRMFAPFQRLGDSPAGQGVGLGLAVARGLTEAMGGTLTAEETPGGGLTMLVSLPAAPVDHAFGPRLTAVEA